MARARGLRQAALMLVVCLTCALLLADFAPAPDPGWQVGEVANRDIKAPFGFDFEDAEATQLRREEVVSSIPQVYSYDATLVSRLRSKVSQAFDIGRRRYGEAMLEVRGQGGDALPPELVSEIGQTFLKQLGVTARAEDIEAIVIAGLPQASEDLINELIAQGMAGYVIPERSYLPSQPQPIRVIRVVSGAKDEVSLENFDEIRTVDEARASVTLYALDHVDDEDDPLARAALNIARAQIRGNLSFDQLLTQQRRERAAESVGRVVQTIARGTAVVRDGDVVTAQQVEVLAAMKAHQSQKSALKVAASVFGFLVILVLAVYRFARAGFRRFTRSARDLSAAGALLVLTALLARVTVELAGPVAQLIGGSMAPQSLWYITPVAGVVLLVRVLVNAETALVFALLAATVCGLAMEGEALTMVFFLVSGVTAAWGIGRSRERRAILWSGVMTGLLNVAFVIFLMLVRANLYDQGPADPTAPIWDVIFAFSGGLLSAFLVLGLVPLFELVGFVTDLQLLELANLDHPLLRNLMLRAPGTYHHSVMVGALAEAASEAVGANALLARVCAYFHDIGKAVRPQYFIENQRDGINRHERLTPYQSAQVIIDHVRDGGAIAREHKLPQPIIDNIFMHHGDGLVYYFYMKAKEEDPEVNPDDFRYPGPRPNTREAGIIMLADKIEAACRSIKQPTPDNVAAMIQKIINSVMADGQFQDCPLTLKELYTIAETFKTTVLAIHHHRIAYPDKPIPKPRGAAEQATKPATRDSVITLEIPPSEVAAARDPARTVPPPEPEDEDGPVDYESPDYLPSAYEERPYKGPER
ncbi:MAG: HDIG domain-containing protein [Alphaproteobacteria bacterium]|nr:HDIG domain-containing protein [Alphaproteobacteria bacterium]